MKKILFVGFTIILFNSLSAKDLPRLLLISKDGTIKVKLVDTKQAMENSTLIKTMVDGEKGAKEIEIPAFFLNSENSIKALARILNLKSMDRYERTEEILIKRSITVDEAISLLNEAHRLDLPKVRIIDLHRAAEIHYFFSGMDATGISKFVKHVIPDALKIFLINIANCVSQLISDNPTREEITYALDMALEQGDITGERTLVLALLLNNINYQTVASRKTPLMVIVDSNLTYTTGRLIKFLLLKEDLQINLQDKNYKTALDYALSSLNRASDNYSQKAKLKIIKLLKQAGAKTSQELNQEFIRQ